MPVLEAGRAKVNSLRNRPGQLGDAAGKRWTMTSEAREANPGYGRTELSEKGLWMSQISTTTRRDGAQPPTMAGYAANAAELGAESPASRPSCRRVGRVTPG